MEPSAGLVERIWGAIFSVVFGEGQMLIAAFAQMSDEVGARVCEFVEQSGECILGDGLGTGGEDFAPEGAEASVEAR